ncbi:MAG: secretin and TonB N-terminal domain-containing protein [Butyricimonas paravirosa]
MKKNIQKLIWIMIKMKLMCLVVALGCTSLNAEVWSQEKKINLQLGEVNLEQLFEQIQQQINLQFVFNHEDVQGYKVNANIKGKTVAEILDAALKDKPLKYEILSNYIVISPKTIQPTQQTKEIKITGKVTDESGEVLPGVSVFSRVMAWPQYRRKIPLSVLQIKIIVLVFSFIGMKTTVKIKSQKTITRSFCKMTTKH